MTAAHVVLAMASGAAFGLPLYAVAVFVARPFARAATRFRIFAAAFAAAALYAPAALVLSLVRPPAPGAHGPLTALDARIAAHAPPAVLAAAALVAAVLLADLVVDLVRLMRIKARSSVDPAQPRQARGAPVASSSRVRTPTAIGYLHPRIVVPADLRARVDALELRAIVAHENAHLVRYDDWSKALQTAIVRLSWFAPALWALAARLDLERELASDEYALQAALDPRAYAACLVRLASDVRHPRPAPAAWTARSQVSIRVERLLRPPGVAHPARRFAALAALAASVCACAASAVFAVPPAGRAPVSRPAAAPIVARAAHRAPVRVAAAVRPKYRVALPRRPRAVVIALRLAPAVARPTARRRPLAAAQPAVEVAAATLPPGPCRTCVMLRRPVVDGPALPTAGTASAPPVSAAIPEDEGSGHGYPWDPGLTPPAGRRTFIEMLPAGR